LWVLLKKNIGGQESYGACNLFIKDLDFNIDQQRLEREFSIFGEIHSVKLLKNNENKSQGCGFVCYKTVEDATRAVIFMNKKKLEENKYTLNLQKVLIHLINNIVQHILNIY